MNSILNNVLEVINAVDIGALDKDAYDEFSKALMNATTALRQRITYKTEPGVNKKGIKKRPHDKELRAINAKKYGLDDVVSFYVYKDGIINETLTGKISSIGHRTFKVKGRLNAIYFEDIVEAAQSSIVETRTFLPVPVPVQVQQVQQVQVQVQQVQPVQVEAVEQFEIILTA